MSMHAMKKRLGDPCGRGSKLDMGGPSRIHAEDREWAVNFCIAQSKAAVNHEADFRTLKKNGEYVWIRDVVHVVRKENGEGDSLVFMFEISDFKQYNDRRGHLEGDQCLKRVAKLSSLAAERPRDFVACFGGEEFVAVLLDTHASEAYRIASRCRGLITGEPPREGSAIGKYITARIGLGTVVRRAARKCMPSSRHGSPLVSGQAARQKHHRQRVSLSAYAKADRRQPTGAPTFAARQRGCPKLLHRGRSVIGARQSRHCKPRTATLRSLGKRSPAPGRWRHSAVSSRS